MAYVNHNATTMARVEDKPATAKMRWRVEEGAAPPSGYVVVVTPERGSNAAGGAI